MDDGFKQGCRKQFFNWEGSGSAWPFKARDVRANIWPCFMGDIEYVKSSLKA